MEPEKIAGQVARMQIGMNCLRWELPDAIWQDMNERWLALRLVLGRPDPAFDPYVEPRETGALF